MLSATIRGYGFGDAGDVSALQTALAAAGYPVAVTGAVNKDTVAAVVKFLVALSKNPPSVLPDSVKQVMSDIADTDNKMLNSTSFIPGSMGGSFGLAYAIKEATAIAAFVAPGGGYDTARSVACGISSYTCPPAMPSAVRSIGTTITTYAAKLTSFINGNAGVIASVITALTPGAPGCAPGFKMVRNGFTFSCIPDTSQSMVPVLVTAAARQPFVPGLGPVTPGISKYPAGAIARLNTSRNVWSVYAPAGLHGAGLGVADESGACMYGVCDAGLGAGVTPAAPTGYTKVGEEPAAGTTSSPAGTQNGGIEKDTHWYSTWWGIGAMIGGAAAIGTGLYYGFRKPRQAAAY